MLCLVDERRLVEQATSMQRTDCAEERPVAEDVVEARWHVHDRESGLKHAEPEVGGPSLQDVGVLRASDSAWGRPGAMLSEPAAAGPGARVRLTEAGNCLAPGAFELDETERTSATVPEVVAGTASPTPVDEPMPVDLVKVTVLAREYEADRLASGFLAALPHAHGRALRTTIAGFVKDLVGAVLRAERPEREAVGGVNGAVARETQLGVRGYPRNAGAVQPEA
jgi:hypothetical protein